MNADIQAFQRARDSVTYTELDHRLAQLEAELLEIECRKTVSIIREARRALKWEITATLPPLSAARINHG